MREIDQLFEEWEDRITFDQRILDNPASFPLCRIDARADKKAMQRCIDDLKRILKRSNPSDAP